MRRLQSTLNQIIEPEQYSLPVIDEIFAMFGGGQNFSKIDLTDAYLAYEIHPDYRKYLTISTPHGLYEFNRLVYGISDAPAKWKKIMDQVLENIPYKHASLMTFLCRARMKKRISRISPQFSLDSNSLDLKWTLKNANSSSQALNFVVKKLVTKGYTKAQVKLKQC